jgi:nicotinamide mononucleotide (NMN) deamidase PncC
MVEEEEEEEGEEGGVHFGVWMQNENVSRRVGFNRRRHVTKNRSMSHRSAVTFDTVCLILFV